VIVGADASFGGSLSSELLARGHGVAATTRRRERATAEGLFLDLAEPIPRLPETDVAIICAAMARFEDCRGNPMLARRVNRIFEMIEISGNATSLSISGPTWLVRLVDALSRSSSTKARVGREMNQHAPAAGQGGRLPRAGRRLHFSGSQQSDHFYFSARAPAREPR
jgi:hypothetical protein